ncbi:hypothetical protein CBW24_02015 [Pacificitalea manganoxidans]|uniref:Uncharacterized protein n=2 Tax=Pacificitalea manganoxidans TaxID=1411902 RepID=A0A291LWT5_9RHOB|nr:hypothetical protein [Pacificitalea manganoxidans]ATI40895.1 hypothetical protein CBW24_02015 [Pacificitalea manganoxidans]MDR6308233.1 hypothetical protein [Pacificitalea manganoxidans]
MASALFDGVRQGAAMLAGAPVDLVNHSPQLLNLLPGEQGVGPISDNPLGGRETWDTLLRVGGAVPDYQPEGGAERVLNRGGEEIGASLLPALGALAKAATTPARVVNQMASAPRTMGEAVQGKLVQPAAVAPGSFAARETAYAGGAGTGAGLANEIAGENRGGVSDFVGSVLGALGVGLASGTGRAVGTLAAGATGSPKLASDAAGEAVADRIINASTDLQEQHARTGTVDAQQLADVLRTPAPVETAVPGYRANIGDRTGDPSLATMAFEQDARAAGAANLRHEGNAVAVNTRMAGMAPQGDPAEFRAALQAGVDQQIDDAMLQEDLVRQNFDALMQDLTPSLGTPQVRGNSIRSGLADAYEAAQQNVRDKYAVIDQANTPVDIGPLRELFEQVDAGLPVNDAQRFRPTEASTPALLAPAKPEAPISTGVLDADGRPILRDPPPVDQTVPYREVASIRSGLTDDALKQRAAKENQAARVTDMYREQVDNFSDQALPEDMRAALTDARAARRDVADRFERPGTGIAETLRPREGGDYRMDPSAVPGRFAQPDSGRLDDLQALLREAGGDPRVRDGLADEVIADVRARGLTEKPDALAKYLDDRSVLLSNFPELRQKLDATGAAAREVQAAQKTSRETQKGLTTPNRSPEANYLQYGDERAADAVRGLVNAKDPKAATRQLLTTAGDGAAREDLRTAFWQEVTRRGEMDAPTTTGEPRWNAKKIRRFLDDPKASAVADELWADDPQALADIKNVFDALSRAEGSTRARAPGTSGTGQALSGKFDPSMSTASLASRARSVNRGQLSPTIAIVDVASTWLRNKSKQVQARAIDELAAKAVNDPEFAAALLEKHNPATAAARGRMLTQKYGLRWPTLVNNLEDDEDDEDDDPLLNAIRRK